MCQATLETTEAERPRPRGRPGGGMPWRVYLRGEQSETERVQRGEVAGGRSTAAHAAHLDTKPHKHATYRARRRYVHPQVHAKAYARLIVKIRNRVRLYNLVLLKNRPTRKLSGATGCRRESVK